VININVSLITKLSSANNIPNSTSPQDFESCEPLTMAPSRVPQKRILGEVKNVQQSNIPSSPPSMKKRKIETFSSPATRFKSSQNGAKGKLGSSQPSQFETEVLEKMTQDMAGLKKHNSEKDQEWARPSLSDFNPDSDNLIFQQIECEEGTLHGGKATVKLFGVTEASTLLVFAQNNS
jgi:DNA polymerase delta subunit 1